MASSSSPKPLLVIPGPIEFDSEVLQAGAQCGTSHMDPAFAKVFGKSLTQLVCILSYAIHAILFFFDICFVLDEA